MIRSLPQGSLAPAVPRRLPRLLAAALLKSASRALDRMAHRLVAPPPRPAIAVSLEFHADAGAPEGALYADGEYVGRIEGITRL